MPIGKGENIDNHQVDIKAADYYRTVLLIIAVISVAVQAAAMGPLRDIFWGFHLYAFLPGWTAVLGWIAVAATAWLMFRHGWRRTDEKFFRLLDRLPAALPGVVLTALFAVLFWLFRSKQTLLGDGYPLTLNLPKGQLFHPREPLAMWFQQVLFRTLSNAFTGTGVSSNEVAHNTVAVGSVLAGILFVISMLLLGCALVHSVRRRTMSPSNTNSLTLLISLILFCQGYSVLFYGYVENYTYYILTVALYLFLSVMYLQRRLPLSVPAVVLVLGIGVHLSSVCLIPSFLFLTALGVIPAGRRIDALIGLAAFVVGAVLLDRLLGRISPGYTLWYGIDHIIGVARTTQGGGAGLSYIFSWTHLRDFVNEQYLIGPIAAFLFVPSFLYAIHRRQYDHVAVFLQLAAVVYLAGSWITAEPALGYARDWDIFAPPAVCFTAAALYLLVSHVVSALHVRRLLCFALVLSAFHLFPWVWINHNETLALERFKTLPLGMGRTEVTVGHWYMRNNCPDDAEMWFNRGLEINPKNVNAHFLLGVMFAMNGKFEPACVSFEHAVSLRPDISDFRQKYVASLLEAGRCYDAVPHLVWLAERIPDEYSYWQRIGEEMTRRRCTSSLSAIYGPLIEAAERRLESNPGDVRTILFAGISLIYCGRSEEAVVKFRRSLEAEPNLAPALISMGMALTRLGRRDEARPYLERFLALYPHHPMAGAARQNLTP